jgi:5'-nucleotidase / UDP-sugar diphosphatase
MRKTLVILGFIFSFSLLSFSQQGKKTEIIILHTNDMHAKIDNMGKLAYLADSLRHLFPYVFLVSAGDNFTGNPVVDQYPDKGYPMIDIMNRCGFNLSELGNHEFDLGQETLEKRFKQAKFPFICCNLDTRATSLDQPEPYKVLDAGEVAHIAFLGVIELNGQGIPDSHPSNLKGIKFFNGIEKAKEYAGLKDKYGILIGLTHLGADTDQKLAAAMPGLDMIIGGHSHTLIDKPVKVGNVLITQDGSGMQYIGKAVLTVENGHVISVTDEAVPVAKLKKSDTAVQAAINRYNDNPEFKKVVGIAAEDLTGPDELGSLMTDALTSHFKTDIAFVNNGGIRINSIPKGPITLRDVYRLDPFGNTVVTFKLSVKEIRSLICYGYSQKKQADLQVSGMTYRIIPGADGTCNEVILTGRDGKPLDESKEYTVAMNSYMAASYKFDHNDKGTTSEETTASVLISYLKDKGMVDYKGVKRALITGK